MASRRPNKIIISCAITGAIHTRTLSDALPFKPADAEQVSKIVRIVRELGSDVATPSVARALLALKGKQAVRL